MKAVRVIIYGVGTVGKEIMRALSTKKGVEIVGAYDKASGIGRDLGDLAGIGKKLGVNVTDNQDALFVNGFADVVIHSTSTRVADAYQQITRAIESKMNVITAAEEMSSPYVYDKASAEQLDNLAKKHGVSVLGAGLWPTWLDIDIPLLLSAGCREVNSVRYSRHSDLSAFSGSVVAKHFGLGVTKEDFEKGIKSGVIVGHVGFEGSFERLAHYFDWKIDSIEKTIEATYGSAGISTAIRTAARGLMGGEVVVEMELHGSVEPGWETYDVVTLDATPPINMTIKPCAKGSTGTANVLVNQIPTAINAAPGIVMRSAVGVFAFGKEAGTYLT